MHNVFYKCFTYLLTYSNQQTFSVHIIFQQLQSHVFGRHLTHSTMLTDTPTQQLTDLSSTKSVRLWCMKQINSTVEVSLHQTSVRHTDVLLITTGMPTHRHQHLMHLRCL